MYRTVSNQRQRKPVPACGYMKGVYGKVRVLLINSNCGVASTGRICTNLLDQMEAEGHQCMIAYGRGEAPEAYRDRSIRIGTEHSAYVNAALARAWDNEGFNARSQTKKLLRWM